MSDEQPSKAASWPARANSACFGQQQHYKCLCCQITPVAMILTLDSFNYLPTNLAPQATLTGEASGERPIVVGASAKLNRIPRRTVSTLASIFRLTQNRSAPVRPARSAPS